MKYRTILLDADDTLLDFQKAEAQGIREAFSIHRLPYSEEILKLYSSVNKKCWEEFELGLLTKPQLLWERFRRLFALLHINADAQQVCRTYEEELGKGAFLTDGAYETCRILSQHCRLSIVTNGVAKIQYSRLSKSGLDRFITDVFISEEIGHQKPQKAYFDKVFEDLGNPLKEELLLVGDSLSADMRGGTEAGIDTCWYNPHKKEKPENMKISYVIDDIRKLPELIFTAEENTIL